jgi:Cu-Zn family superoxide dismutase
MTRRLNLIAATGFFGAALFAANKPVTVTLKDGTGKDVGTAKISDGAGGQGAKVALTVKELPPGEHALHFHATAKCEGPAFTSAGGHFNPTTAHHGINNPATPKPHAGDMPNFTVKPNGTAKVTVTDSAVTLGEGSNSLFTNGGTALVIHAKADDLMSDPSGNAGDRIACGTVTK